MAIYLGMIAGPWTVLMVQPDLLAGLSVAALVIPQGMSYAKLAGLPSVYGLYGAFVPVLCYAALGTSRHLVQQNPTQFLALPVTSDSNSSPDITRQIAWSTASGSSSMKPSAWPPGCIIGNSMNPLIDKIQGHTVLALVDLDWQRPGRDALFHWLPHWLGSQAVGPVAVTSLLLGNGLQNAISGPVQANPNAPVNQKAQDEYNHAAIQVCVRAFHVICLDNPMSGDSCSISGIHTSILTFCCMCNSTADYVKMLFCWEIVLQSENVAKDAFIPCGLHSWFFPDLCWIEKVRPRMLCCPMNTQQHTLDAGHLSGCLPCRYHVYTCGHLQPGVDHQFHLSHCHLGFHVWCCGHHWLEPGNVKLFYLSKFPDESQSKLRG